MARWAIPMELHSLLLAAESRCTPARQRLEMKSEQLARNQGWLGRSQTGPPGAEWARTMPLVLAGGSAGPVYVLFGLLRTRVETAHATRIRSRAGIRARPRHLRQLRYRQHRGCPAIALLSRRKAQCPPHPLGSEGTYAQEFMGCRPYFARR